MPKRIREVSDAEEAAIQAGIAQDPDNPELTDEELSRLRPAEQVLPPALYENLIKRRRGQRGPQKAPTKQVVTLRLDRDVVERFRAAGEGWQTRINAVLKLDPSGTLAHQREVLVAELERLQRGGRSGEAGRDQTEQLLDSARRALEAVDRAAAEYKRWLRLTRRGTPSHPRRP